MKFLKPKFWGKKKNIYSVVLYPISIFYKLILVCKKKITRAEKFKISVLCIGNIYLGGTGKTPLAIFLHNELKKIRKPVIIKKYYRDQLDEQDLIRSNKVSLIVDKKRNVAIRQAQNKGFDLAILDDGFQDYSIKKDLNIICFNSKQLAGNELLLPSGPLRDEFSAIKKAKIIIINGEKNEPFEEKLFNESKNIKIYYSKYFLENADGLKEKKLLAFAGIGNPNNFFDLLKENNLEVKKKIYFPDHYNYEKKELEKIIFEAKENNLEIITTEKDYERIKYLKFERIKFLRISLKIEKKDKLINQVLNYLK